MTNYRLYTPVKESVSEATSVSQLGETRVYRGAYIVILDDKIRERKTFYVIAAENTSEGLEINVRRIDDSGNGFSEVAKLVDSLIDKGVILEDWEPCVSDIDELYFESIRTHARHLEGKNKVSDIDATLSEMHTTGGIQEVLFEGKYQAGCIVEIFYDPFEHKLRARANDGEHGLAMVAFPNALREKGAVYIVPSRGLTWNGKNYRATTTSLRIR